MYPQSPRPSPPRGPDSLARRLETFEDFGPYSLACKLATLPEDLVPDVGEGDDDVEEDEEDWGDDQAAPAQPPVDGARRSSAGSGAVDHRRALVTRRECFSSAFDDVVSWEYEA